MPLPSGFLKSQCCARLPIPSTKFTGQTIIVTGANVGLGLEAARHFVRLDAAKVILAVRSLDKGQIAKQNIEQSEKKSGVVEVWELDLANYASVIYFASRAQTLDRLDVIVENAETTVRSFRTAEDNESTITVNVISTFLLALLLVPKLRETSVALNKATVLTFTGSYVHAQTPFSERSWDDILEGLSSEKHARMNDRYNVSKLIQLLCTRELAKEVSRSSKEGKIVVSIVNPGEVDSARSLEASCPYSLFISGLKRTMSRSAEEGSRTLVIAAEGDEKTHGQYLDDCKVGRVSSFAASPEGENTQERLWFELSNKLEEIHPGILENA